MTVVFRYDLELLQMETKGQRGFQTLSHVSYRAHVYIQWEEREVDKNLKALPALFYGRGLWFPTDWGLFWLKRASIAVYLKTKYSETESLKNGNRWTEASSWSAVNNPLCVRMCVRVSGRRESADNSQQERKRKLRRGERRLCLGGWHHWPAVLFMQLTPLPRPGLKIYLQHSCKVILQPLL